MIRLARERRRASRFGVPKAELEERGNFPEEEDRYETTRIS